MTVLLDNVSANVTDPTTTFTSKGGPAVVTVRVNDLDGGTVEIQTRSFEDNLDRFATLASGSFTTDATVTLDYLPNGTVVRAIVTGVGASGDGIHASILQ